MNEDPKVFRENHIDPKKNTEQGQRYYQELNQYIESSTEGGLLKFRTFSRYTPRSVLAEFLVKYEIFQKILDVPGSIIECGVLNGQGLMSFAQFSSIMEPVHFNRKVIGFDTFGGFPELDDKDMRTSTSPQMTKGGYAADSYEGLKKAIQLYDMDRPLGHIDKVELVKGDVTKTLPEYVKANPHLIVALLYLDMDIYKPTKVALEQLLPRIPKGGIIAFDELNMAAWPGETMAVMETLGLNKLRLKRIPFQTRISYAVME